MTPTVAIIAPGRMGSAIARRLVESGIEVRTSLAGRSRSTADRARAAGMRIVTDEEVAQVDLVLSIVPPAQALAAAERMAPFLRTSARAPLYVDLNAIGPETSACVERAIAAAGGRYVDGCIIGLPPAEGYAGPFLYLAGDHAGPARDVLALGLDVTMLEGGNGAASALKMCFGGLMKGITAIGSAMFVTASRAGAADAMTAELARSQPELHAWFARQIPAMYPKTYRWVAEMEEVASFSADGDVAAIYGAIARLYSRLSSDSPETAADIAALGRLFGGAGPAPTGARENALAPTTSSKPIFPARTQ
ncbi:DUF1932 domain-containing protein [Faunimonas sp. B44]|uniref:DUF1932 domain-containing protein n=1 Tax=Faunimonas sp. B44 TaxID=3461493 RepID=UPI0040446CF7